MVASKEEERYVETVMANCKLLVSGYRERIEYQEPVKYHSPDCVRATMKVAECDCRVEMETRARHVQRRGLLDQLDDFTKNRDCDLSPKAARGAPRVKKAKLNPELNGYLTLDEITCDVYMSLDRIFEEAERDRTYLSQPVRVILPGLANQVRYMIDAGRPDLARQVSKLTRKWVDSAKRTLNHTVSDAMFGDVVCGNCGGGLVGPGRVEGEGAIVRCAGSPAEAPCGQEYPASEWLELYEKGRR